MLLHGCYNLHTREEPDDGPVRGDHFLLEALLRRPGVTVHARAGGGPP